MFDFFKEAEISETFSPMKDHLDKENEEMKDEEDAKSEDSPTNEP
jgi:hypothetical protein